MEALLYEDGSCVGIDTNLMPHGPNGKDTTCFSIDRPAMNENAAIILTKQDLFKLIGELQEEYSKMADWRAPRIPTIPPELEDIADQPTERLCRECNGQIIPSGKPGRPPVRCDPCRGIIPEQSSSRRIATEL